MTERKRFVDVEFDCNNTTYYASGHVDLSITEGIGTNYEGYDYEIIVHSEVVDIVFDEIYYIDEDINGTVNIAGLYRYMDVEERAIELVMKKYN